MSRASTARRDRIWLECVDIDYMTPREIAERCGYPVRTVRAGIQRARGLKLEIATIWQIEWMSPPVIFNEAHQCEWHAFSELPQGIAKGCLCCLRSGLESLIARSRPKTEPGKPGPSEKREDFAHRHHKQKVKK